MVKGQWGGEGGGTDRMNWVGVCHWPFRAMRAKVTFADERGRLELGRILTVTLA